MPKLRYHSRMVITEKQQAWGAVGLVVVAAATAPVFIRYAQLEGVPSLSIIAIRLMLSAAVLAPFAIRQHGDVLQMMTRQDWLWAAGAGLFHALGLVCLFFALENTSVLVNSVLRRTSPLWTILLEVMLLQVVFGRRVWGGIFLTLFGSLLVVFGGIDGLSLGDRPFLGALLSLINALTLSIYLIIGRQLRYKLPFLAYSWVLFSAATIVSLLFAFFTNSRLLGHSWIGYVWILVVAIVAQLAGHLPMNFALGHFPATYLTVLLQASVIISAVIAFITFREVPTLMQLLGSLVIIMGMTFVSFQKRPTA